MVKPTYLILSIFLPIWGCSSTYRTGDFSSSDKFYQDFNKFAGDKDLKIVLVNDKTIKAFAGSKISGDTIAIITRIKRQPREIKSSQVLNIIYSHDNTNFQKNTATIFLHNGYVLSGENVIIKNDSSINFTEIERTTKYYPVSKVWEAYYNSNWAGVLPGFLYGSAAGLLVGLAGIIPIYTHTEGNPRHGSEYNYPAAMAVGLFSGIGMGIIAGWLRGRTYIYKFH